MTLSRLFLLLLLSASLAACGTLRGDRTDDEAQTAQALYEQAQAAGRRGEFETAIRQLEQLQAQFPFGHYARQAQLDIIHMYFRAEDMDSTVAAADRYMRLYPRDENVAYAYYMRATANMNRGRDFLTGIFRIDRSMRDPEPLRQAYADFRYLAQNFPDTEYADDARDQMTNLRMQLAEHELYVADYYMRRGAYVAAARRAQGVVEQFNDTPAYEDALHILSEAYERLEMDDLREEIRQLLETAAAV
ncbi:hypothetical protein CAI21_01355 [Alkalilimnicola ehrlichii]|uniref:Outer membrane protein assembly factor BamD n=1 Tax=Alkalilimnicola ehrlichii TaxID=351052 RepID=A0A3E0X3K4_9GAMM|nr:outer membrane protein assembly factor BamD [Alkalilimnicola ehrlichii]RFA31307.1 hypothetical protein CAI21_01355 [Alkalilimnicola ehrlichii]RFA39420.1 hypothetical protein CAL65_01055 [Alkalilimnicola ehrlichii]